MKVKATETGFFAGTLRYPGEVFDVPKDSKATWFSPVEDEQPVKPKGRSSSSGQAAESGSGQSSQ